MSYILEALKRSEQRRNRGLPPSPARQRARRRRSLRRWTLGLAVLLILNLGVLGLDWWQRQAQAPAGNAGTTPPAPDTVAPASGSSVVGAPRAAAALVPPDPAPHDPAPVAAVSGTPPASAPIAGADVRPPAPRTPASEPLPDWGRIPALPASLSPGDLQVHVHAADPARAFVMFDGDIYRTGDRLPGGSRLQQITPKGVVLEHLGSRYRLQRPES